MTIPFSVLEAAIAALEVHAQHPDTGALHDPIYAVLKGDASQEAAISAALTAHVSHPAAQSLRDLFEGHLVLQAPTIADVMARHGATPGADPVGELDRMLAAASESRRVLASRVASLEAETHALGRTANGMAAVGALVAVFGVIGWLVALGWLEIAWIDPAVPQDVDAAAAGRGTVAPSERRIK